jgi:hypothetical protein
MCCGGSLHKFETASASMEIDSKITVESVVTLIVGLFVFILYRFGKSDEKKRAARIILSEVRQAELAIVELRKSKNIGSFTSIMPTNKWQDNKHLFATDLDQDEFDSINNFYQYCLVIEENITFVKKASFVALEEKFRILQQMISEGYKDPEKVPLAVTELYLKDTHLATPDRPKEEAFKNIEIVSLIMNGSAVSKLKRIIIRKWYKPKSWLLHS